MSVSIFEDGRWNGPGSGTGVFPALRRLLFRLAIFVALAAAVGVWIRFELPDAMDGYTQSD